KEETCEVLKDEEEECEEEEPVENSGEDEEYLQKAKQAITCRSVTLNTLMEDGIISHGKGVLSIDYLGQRFEADLLETGKIKWHGSQEEFNTPSAWALHCKRLVNPIKRSGCGWASVKYKSRKLDIWKSMWARKHRTVNPFKVSIIFLYLLTLVKCEQFDQHSKIQPFTVSITSNTLLLMDFHCHLTKSEVVGYLGGRWDSHTQHLSIEQAFPARCRLGDKDRAPLVEEEIRRNMRHKNQMVVGWYHSHPYCQPDPSIRDVDCQMSYQLKMRGSGSMYLPCLGFIISPFEKLPPKPDSKIQSFWVMPNLEHPASYNIPMHISYSVVRDSSLTEDLLSDMKHLTEFYRLAVDKVNLKEHWGEAITYKDKIKASLRSKLPEDQLDSGTFLDYVQQLLTDMR
ncbi:unnamed protein product, partial [Candidula unifasciata]